MPIQNAQVAAMFDELADLLEIEGANPFRIRAYRNAAHAIGVLGENVEDMVARGENLRAIPGIGAAIADKVIQIVTTGRLTQLEDLRARYPAGLGDMLALASLGPKRVKALYEGLGVSDLDALEQAALQGKIRELPGFGERMEQNILEEVERARTASRRVLLVEAEVLVAPIVAHLRAIEGVRRVEVAGSLRRRRETIGDVDIVVTAADDARVTQGLAEYAEVQEVEAHGHTRASVRLRPGLEVDLRAMPEESYGAALVYFTGSKAHNVRLRTLAVKMNYKVNEYGVYHGARWLAGAEEEDVYRALGLPWIPPELREDRGEIDAALAGTLPRLVTVEDLRGDLQAHTVASDGKATLEEMARAAQARGYEYLAITDHSPSLRVAGGLEVERLARQMDEIDRLNETLEGFRLLKSSEIEILPDGSLDLPDDLLARLDVRICAIHSRLNLSREAQTERVLRAMDNPYFGILAHPTERLIGQRPPIEIDMERLLRGARERGCYVEVNAQPYRLDLDDVYCRLAKEIGVRVAISTDAHSPGELDYMRFGVDQARRGWLEPDDVLNTRSWEDLRPLLERRELTAGS